MKKTNSLYIVIIVLLCVVAVLLAGVLGVSLLRHRYQVLPGKKVDTAEYMQVTDTAYENVYNTIALSSNCGNIFVLTSEDAQIHLKIWADEDKVSIQETGSMLYVTADARNQSKIGINNVNIQQVRVELYLPADYDKSLALKTDYGNAEVESFPQLQLKTESAYGSLTLDEVASLEAELDYGSIKAGTIYTCVAAECEMGNIDIERLMITTDSKLACEMGNIRIGSAPSAIVDADTGLGSVDVRPNPADASVRLILENDNGSITVK